MTSSRRRLVLWGILVCSTIFTTYTLWSNRARTAVPPSATATTESAAPATASAPAATAPATTAAAPAPQAPPLSQAELSEWRSGLDAVRRDPFFTVAELEAMSRQATSAPARAVAAPGQPAYTVKLVMMAGPDRHALVDRQVVTVGDMIGNERVAEIAADAVVLERDGRRRRLPVATGGSSPVEIRQEPTR